jgi:NAD(P)-dependent dehydrogenase (short-subunit alcohol dehydrogenase family)
LALDAGAVVVAADVDGTGAEAVAAGIAAEAAAGRRVGFAAEIDVTDEAAAVALIDGVEESLGPIELWCGNAGISRMGGVERPDEEWNLVWDVNLMAHVIACRHLVPRWVDRGSGHLLVTASAAGLLTGLGTASYAVTKHAAVALAEFLAIAYGDRGVRVSVLCPQAVRTAMTSGREEGVASIDGMIEPEELADCVIETMDREEFLILPHPQVLEYMRRKTADYDRWLAGMRRLRHRFAEE